MLRGGLNPDESGGLALIRRIVMLLAGETTGRGQKLCFSVPARRVGSSSEPDDHEGRLQHARRTWLRRAQHFRRPGRGVRRDGKLQLYRHRDQLRRRTVQGLPGAPLGSGVELQHSQGGRFYRLQRRQCAGESRSRASAPSRKNRSTSTGISPITTASKKLCGKAICRCLFPKTGWRRIPCNPPRARRPGGGTQ